MPPRIAPAVVRAGLPEQLRFHDLRHTAAALLIAEGAAMEQVNLSQTRISAGRNRR